MLFTLAADPLIQNEQEDSGNDGPAGIEGEGTDGIGDQILENEGRPELIPVLYGE